MWLRLTLVALSLLLSLPCAAAFARHTAPLTGAAATRWTRAPLFASASFRRFEDFVNNPNQPVLVDFYAQWCGPCQLIQPVLEDLANRFEGRARIAKVDTDKAPALGARFQVEAFPTLILFFQGREVQRYEGFKSADALAKELHVALRRLGR
eukprot:gene16212-11598_t